jgi:CspA family cold shock protein
MAYQDIWVTCTGCGKQFVYRVEEQRRQAGRGEEVKPPELCPSCRAPAGAEREPEPRREPRPRPKPSAERESKTLAELGPGPHEGNVKWYDGEKGYGFITHGSGEDIFFHRTGIAPGEIPDFPDGTRVTFLVEETEKGPQAVDVERMEGE